jgi:hypothetical protein
MTGENSPDAGVAKWVAAAVFRTAPEETPRPARERLASQSQKRGRSIMERFRPRRGTKAKTFDRDGYDERKTKAKP